MIRFGWGVAAVLGVLAGGCIWKYECVDPAVRRDGECVRLDDADAGADSGSRDGGPSADGEIDGCTPEVFYRDVDGDEFGDDADTMNACAAPEGYVATAGDCDDTTETTHPSATETCNQTDDDCDVAIDEGTRRLLGSPITLGSGYDPGVVVDIASYDLGFFVVWTDAAGALQQQAFSASGGDVRSAQPVAATVSGRQIHPSVTVTRTGGVQYAVVLWNEEYARIRGRVFPLDGRAPSPPFQLDSGTGLQAVAAPGSSAAGSRVIAAWLNFDADEVRAQAVDSASGMPIDGPSTVYRYEMPVWIAGHPFINVESDTVTAGLWDQRTGDTAATGYLLSSPIDDLGNPGAPARIRPDETEAVYRLLGGTVAGSLFVLAFSTGGDQGSLYYGPAPEPPAIPGELRELSDTGFPLDSSVLPGGVAVVHSPLGDLPGERSLWLSELSAGEATGSFHQTIAMAQHFQGAGVAYHDSGVIGVAYARTDSTGATEVALQRLGCE